MIPPCFAVLRILQASFHYLGRKRFWSFFPNFAGFKRNRFELFGYHCDFNFCDHRCFPCDRGSDPERSSCVDLWLKPSRPVSHCFLANLYIIPCTLPTKESGCMVGFALKLYLPMLLCSSSELFFFFEEKYLNRHMNLNF